MVTDATETKIAEIERYTTQAQKSIQPEFFWNDIQWLIRELREARERVESCASWFRLFVSVYGEDGKARNDHHLPVVNYSLACLKDIGKTWNASDPTTVPGDEPDKYVAEKLREARKALEKIRAKAKDNLIAAIADDALEPKQIVPSAALEKVKT